MGTPRDDAPLKANWFQILLALADRELHGYAIRGEVRERTGETVNLWPGVLYRSLAGLADAGLIEECADPNDAPVDARERRYYRITAAGQAALRSEAARMAEYVEVARLKEVLP